MASGTDKTGKAVMEQPSSEPPSVFEEHPTTFHKETEEQPQVAQCTDDTSRVPNISKVVNTNADKSGVAFLCVCTSSPKAKNFIKDCTVMERMQECLDTKLGYLTIPLGTNVSSSQFDAFIAHIEALTLPASYNRVIFYFFGHGNDNLVMLSDQPVERKFIISKLQKICSPESDVYKILIFDSCRIENDVTTKPVQESGEQKPLYGDGPPWRAEGNYPALTNTLVINATDCNSLAYYKVMNGCGLMTHYFAELAPKLNESLRDLLAAIRQEVIAMTTSEMTQVLVYEDKLIGKCNLLAESRGTARVVPTGVQASPAVLTTNVHLKFDDKVEQRIKTFLVQVSSNEFRDQVTTKSILPCDRMATIHHLAPGTAYSVRVVAVYEDGMEAMSKICTFTTAGRESPSDIKVTPQYPGSPRAKVEWSYRGETSDLCHFRVTIQVDEEELNSQDVPANKADVTVKGLIPLRSHQITVTAVYCDELETEGRVKFQHTDLSSPRDVKAKPDYRGSPNATVTWNFAGPTKDLSHFHVTVEAEGLGNVFGDSVIKAADERSGERRSHKVKNLCPLRKHMIAVVAVYADGNQKVSSVELEHDDRCGPEGMRITQVFKGSNEANVTWSFPGDIAHDLECFRLSVKRKSGDGDDIYSKNVAATNKNDTITNLRPNMDYVVTVTAIYRDAIERKSSLEHLVETSHNLWATVNKLHYSRCKRMKTGPQKACCRTLLLLLYACIFTFISYDIELRRSSQCQTDYVVMCNSIDCGEANSLQITLTLLKARLVSIEKYVAVLRDSSW